MALTVTIEKGAVPPSQIVAANIVQQHARNLGSPYAARAAGVTLPVIRINQSRLEYEQRRASGRIEFRFTAGNLTLTLRQAIYLSNTLSGCAQTIWEAHEQDHVQDYQDVMRSMEAEFRRHRAVQDILIAPRWRPVREFSAVQSTIQSTVGEIFRRLCRETVLKRDTDAVYKAIQEKIKADCG